MHLTLEGAHALGLTNRESKVLGGTLGPRKLHGR